MPKTENIYINPSTGEPWDCVESIYTSGLYIKVKVPCHPNANKQGFVMEHRLIMEGIIGRFLLPTEEVHHKDRDKHNNKPSNLEVLSKQSHREIHGKEFAKRAWQTVMRKRKQKRNPNMARKKKKTIVITTSAKNIK